MSRTIVTNAPEVYDYPNTVQSSTPLKAQFSEKTGLSRSRYPFRRVVLDDREDGYYANYQTARYQSGGHLVLSSEQYQKEVQEGYITE